MKTNFSNKLTSCSFFSKAPTNGGTLTATAAQLEGFDTIRFSAVQAGTSVSSRVRDGIPNSVNFIGSGDRGQAYAERWAFRAGAGVERVHVYLGAVARGQQRGFLDAGHAAQARQRRRELAGVQRHALAQGERGGLVVES